MRKVRKKYHIYGETQYSIANSAKVGVFSVKNLIPIFRINKAVLKRHESKTGLHFQAQSFWLSVKRRLTDSWQ